MFNPNIQLISFVLEQIHIPLSLIMDTTRKIAKIALITNPKTPK